MLLYQKQQTDYRQKSADIFKNRLHSFGTRLIKNVKKMSLRKSNAKLGNILGYTFPRLHTGKQWYVDFQATDPETGSLKRKKYHITSQKSRREMKKAAEALIEKLSMQLRQGWTPWESNKNIRGTKLFDEVLDKYLSTVRLTSRKSTLENYTSRVNVLRDYIKGLAQPIKYAFQYDKTFVTDFLDWTVEKRNASPRTRNNYRGWCCILAQFMIERQYITENPVTAIRKIRETKKNRQPLTETMLRQLWS